MDKILGEFLDLTPQSLETENNDVRFRLEGYPFTREDDFHEDLKNKLGIERRKNGTIFVR